MPSRTLKVLARIITCAKLSEDTTGMLPTVDNNTQKTESKDTGFVERICCCCWKE
jgi:hypothetical protein